MEIIYFWLYLLIITSSQGILLAEQIVSHSGSIIKEYCPASIFNPKCASDEIIAMEHALYGRMKIGQCLERDFGNIGCQLNELSYFDEKCSGVQKCEVPIPDTNLLVKLTCLTKGLSPYLEASYSCQKVFPLKTPCSSPKKIDATPKDQMISSILSKETSCGQQNTPFVIEAKHGQTLNISLIDFSFDSNRVVSNSGICLTYGYIMDTMNNDVVTICGIKERRSHLYTSSGHIVQIMLEASVLQDNKFLLGFKAIGCPDIVPPEYGWIQKEGDTVTVGCYASSHTWQLKCVDNSWIGVSRNCTPVKPSTLEIVTVRIEKKLLGEIDDAEDTSNLSISTNHVLIVIIGCLTLIFCSVVIIAGIYCIKRYQRKAHESRNIYQPYTDPSIGGTLIYKPSLINTPNQESMMMIPSYTLSMPRNDVVPPEVPERNASMKCSFTSKTNGNTNDLLGDQEYPDNTFVKYYVLENNGGSTDSQQLYQNM